MFVIWERGNERSCEGKWSYNMSMGIFLSEKFIRLMGRDIDETGKA